MPVKSFPIPLGNEDVLHVRIVIEQGAVVDYSVRYEAVIDHRPVQLVLCDGSHGRGHCHRLDEKGEKTDRIWAREGISLGDALTEQIEDLAANWPRVRQAFVRDSKRGRGEPGESRPSRHREARRRP